MRKLLRTIFAVAVVALLKAIKSNRHVRLGWINQGVIGHMALDTWIQSVRARESRTDFNTLDIWIPNSKPCNETLHNLIQKELRISNSILLQKTLKALQAESVGDEFLRTDYVGWADGFEVNSTDPFLTLSPEQEDNGWRELKQLKIEPGLDRIVVICVRDGNHEAVIDGYKESPTRNSRNADFTNYLEATELLIESGYTVFRMGRHNLKQFKHRSEKFIDYAFSNIASDFMDVFLMAKAEFCVSTGTGIDSLATIFNKPVYLCDNFNIHDFYSIKSRPWMLPKSLIHCDTGQLVNPYFLLEPKMQTVLSDYELSSRNFNLVQNTSAQILDYFRAILGGGLTANLDFEDVRAQRYLDRFNGAKTHLFIPRVSSLWNNFQTL